MKTQVQMDRLSSHIGDHDDWIDIMKNINKITKVNLVFKSNQLNIIIIYMIINIIYFIWKFWYFLLLGFQVLHLLLQHFHLVLSYKLLRMLILQFYKIHLIILYLSKLHLANSLNYSKPIMDQSLINRFQQDTHHI